MTHLSMGSPEQKKNGPQKPNTLHINSSIGFVYSELLLSGSSLGPGSTRDIDKYYNIFTTVSKALHHIHIKALIISFNN